MSNELKRAVGVRQAVLHFFSATILLASCSFQSNQLDFMKNMFEKKMSETVAQWELTGGSSVVNLFPVAASGEIVFADGDGIYLRFDGWHFVEISLEKDAEALGYPRNSQVNSRYQYRRIENITKSVSLQRGPEVNGGMDLNGVNLGQNITVSCTDWRRLVLSEGALLVQDCQVEARLVFENRIKLDRFGNIVLLESVDILSGTPFQIALKQ
jgi:hypothetical protein